MTKKDYELIAEGFQFAIYSLSDTEFNKCYEGWRRSTDIVADYLQKDNPKFNRNKFLQACGIETRLSENEIETRMSRDYKG